MSDERGEPSPMETINQIIICRVAQREHIGFNGDQQFIRCLWELSQHRLTADDDKGSDARR